VPVEANGDPKCIEMSGDFMPVDGNGDTVETNGDPINTDEEREPEA